MNPGAITSWIKHLGHRYAELVIKGIVPNQALAKPFKQSNFPSLHLANGVELVFEGETDRLVQVMIILRPTSGQSVYRGELPPPFSLNMNRDNVHSLFSNPLDSRGPVRLPGGLGMRGGWDTYLLGGSFPASTKVTFSYLENLQVNNISFSLLE